MILQLAWKFDTAAAKMNGSYPEKGHFKKERIVFQIIFENIHLH